MKASDWLLKLDHDNYNSRRPSLTELVRRAERAGLVIVRLWQRRSPSGKGWHRMVQVSPPPEDAARCVALQLLFGSDPLREAYNYRRTRRVLGSTVAPYWCQLKNWNILYTRPGLTWQRVEAKVLTAHRERNGSRARTLRGIER